MFGRVLNMPLTNGFISGPYSNIWVGKTKVSDFLLDIIFVFFTLQH